MWSYAIGMWWQEIDFQQSKGATKLLNAVLTPTVLDNIIKDTLLEKGELTKVTKAGFPSIAELAPTQALFNRISPTYPFYRAVIQNKKIINTTQLNYNGYSQIVSSMLGNNSLPLSDSTPL